MRSRVPAGWRRTLDEQAERSGLIYLLELNETDVAVKPGNDKRYGLVFLDYYFLKHASAVTSKVFIDVSLDGYW